MNSKQIKNSGRSLPQIPISGSLQFNELYKLLNDKRMDGIIDIYSGVWHLYRKQTAEYLLNNFDITPKKINTHQDYIL